MTRRRQSAVGVIGLFGLILGLSGNVAAQNGPECGQPYEIGRGDSLFEIARTLYGDAMEWSRIFYANQDVLGEDPARIFPGQTIVPPCDAPKRAADTSVAEIPAPVPEEKTEERLPEVAERLPQTDTGKPPATDNDIEAVIPNAKTLSFLTADDLRPFADRSLPAGGMITELITSAMEQAGIPHEIIWVNDRSAHLDTLLGRHLFDFGFPWTKPDCASSAGQSRCLDFLYSEPVFEVLIKFFTLRDSDFTFEMDRDVEGRRLCRPAGHGVGDLDAKGRNWLRDGKVILLRPDEVRKCFELLLQEKVDAVAINEFTGLEAVAQLDIDKDVVPTLRAISTESLHIAIAKHHPRAATLVTRINESLDAIRENGIYRQTVADHLALFWRDNG